MILKISASAGSGKTYTLTRRFLALLAGAQTQSLSKGCVVIRRDTSYSLPEILAATFTNKAAAEMKDRVLLNLKERALAEKAGSRITEGSVILSPSEAGLWVERILRHYGSLNIRTIDSLLATLVRISALELGLAPDFQPSFSSVEYFSPLYDSLMEDIRSDRESVTTHTPPLFLSCDGATLRSAVEKGCASLLTLTDFKGFTPRRCLHDYVLELVERLLAGKEVPDMDASAIHARLSLLHTSYTRAAERLLRILSDESLSVNANYMKYLSRCCSLEKLSGPPDSVYADKESLEECLNKASRGKASEAASAAFDLFFQEQLKYPRSRSLFRHALQLAPLTVLAKEIFSRMSAGQSEKTLLAANRLPYLAGQVLSGDYGVPDALCRLGSRLSQLMLDEFQDTSLEQWDAVRPLVVESLSYGGSLTYVGDVKQAIYSWRGGDARLFDHVPHEPELKAIAGSEISEETLPCNWRSSPIIVQHNNTFFGLLSRPDIARECLTAMLPAKTPGRWAETAAQDAVHFFSSVHQQVPCEKQWSQDPAVSKSQVSIYIAEAESTESVVALVKQRLRPLLQNDLLERWKPGEIALLVLSNSEAGLLAEWLTDWGIPVVTENSFLLASHPLIGRLVSFLSFLDYPLDDLAFWEFVSGPECLAAALRREKPADEEPDCSLPDYDWPARKTLEYGGKRPPLYQLFRHEYPGIWERWIYPFFNEAGLMSAYDTIRELLRRYRLLDSTPDRAPFLQRFLEFAHLAEVQGHTSLAAFLAFWEDSKENEKLPLAESMDAIRIMTVHKAKGLEFPVVVLPFQHRALRREPELAVVDVENLRILTRAEKTLESIHYPALIINELERLNLLYVSWTRPIYALHAFVTRPKSTTSLSKALEVLLDHYRKEAPADYYIWEELLADEEEVGPAHTPEPSSTVNAILPQGESRRHENFFTAVGNEDEFYSAWRPMDWLPRLKIYRSTLESARLTPKRRGILAHLCLEHLTISERSGDLEEGSANAHDTLKLDVTRAVRQAMRLFPMPLEQPEAVAKEMEACLYWFACLPQAPLWLKRGRREQGIADAAGNMHRVDLLVDACDHERNSHDEKNYLHAVDYKTGLYPEATLLMEHHEQVRRYMRLLKEATGRPVRGSLVYLDARRLEEVALVEA